MATVKKGILAKSPEWWKHLRWTKRKFWHRERAATHHDIADRQMEACEHVMKRHANVLRELAKR